jgi:hypothetical protein
LDSHPEGRFVYGNPAEAVNELDAVAGVHSLKFPENSIEVLVSHRKIGFVQKAFQSSIAFLLADKARKLGDSAHFSRGYESFGGDDGGMSEVDLNLHGSPSTNWW